jgi:dTDP-4-amino-4,6-dideoxygalactose transaminase
LIKENFEFVAMFENIIAEFTGAKYAIATDSGTSAIFLALQLLKEKTTITIPNHTYQSVPMQIIHSGHQIKFEKKKWIGRYNLLGTNIWDYSAYFKEKMYVKGTIQCLSFGPKKCIPIGRGGMILTDDFLKAKQLCRMAFDGRDRMKPCNKDEHIILGWHMHMIPEEAAKGIILFNLGNYKTGNLGKWKDYKDLSKYKVWNS